MISQIPADAAFEFFVQSEVSRGVAQATDFRALLAALPGIGPIETMHALQRMRDDPAAAALVFSATHHEPPQRLPQGNHLPLPHPLDLEWRFSEASVQKLLERVIQAAPDDDAVLLLGVPTVAAAALNTDARRRFHVIGESNVVCRALIEASAGDSRFVHGASSGELVRAALVDPPWYLDSFADMVGLCSVRCARGATLFLVLPPVGVRPSAQFDRERMIDIAQHAGFELGGSTSEPIRYRTPLFELAALRAAGIGAWLPDWRTGDLVHMTKVREPNYASPQAPRPASFDLTLGGVRLRLLLERSGPRSLEPLALDGVVPSVSLRYPERDRASLWTSTNRAFAIDSSLALGGMLALAKQRGIVLPQGLTAANSVDGIHGNIDETQRLTHLIERLADEERAAAAELVGEAAWLNINDARFLPKQSPGSPRVLRGAAA